MRLESQTGHTSSPSVVTSASVASVVPEESLLVVVSAEVSSVVVVPSVEVPSVVVVSPLAAASAAAASAAAYAASSAALASASALAAAVFVFQFFMPLSYAFCLSSSVAQVGYSALTVSVAAHVHSVYGMKPWPSGHWSSQLSWLI